VDKAIETDEGRCLMGLSLKLSTESVAGTGVSSVECGLGTGGSKAFVATVLERRSRPECIEASPESRLQVP
jgi:hypothetical protein